MSILVPIDSIKIGPRFRRHPERDVEELAASIEAVGLLHPVVLRRDLTLIAGKRRIAAYKHLGRSEIPATIVDLEDVRRGQLHENTQRVEFTPTEIYDIYREIGPGERAAAKERKREHGGTAPGKHSAKLSRTDAGRVTDRIGRFVGLSGRTVEKIVEICQAAEDDPESFSARGTDGQDRQGRPIPPRVPGSQIPTATCPVVYVTQFGGNLPAIPSIL